MNGVRDFGTGLTIAFLCGVTFSCNSKGVVPDAGDEPIAPLPPDCPNIPSTRTATIAERDQLFDFLTANGWTNVGQTLRLRRGGSFWRQAHGYDFIGPVQEGSWSLHAHDARSGMVFLDDLGVWPVARTDDDRLLFDFIYFGAESVTAYSADEARRTAAGLSAGRLPELLRPILNVCWQKANNLNVNREAQFISFAPDGHFRATFRDGTCVQDGTFGFDAHSRDFQLALLGDRSCSLDSRDPVGLRLHPLLLNDTLVLDGVLGRMPSEHHARVFRRSGSDQATSTFIERGLMLEVAGSYQGSPTAGQPWPMIITIKSTMLAVRVTSITVDAQLLSIVDGRLQPAGSVQPIYQHTPDVTLPPGSTHQEAISATFPEPGPLVQLGVRIDTMIDGGTGPVSDLPSYAFVIAVDPGQ